MPIALPSDVVAALDAEFNWLPNGKGQPFRIDHPTCTVLETIVEMVERIPDYLITVTPQEFFDFTRSVVEIRASVANFRKIPAGSPSNIYVMLPLVKGESPIYRLRHLLAECPNSIPSPTTTELPFFANVDLREEIRLDLSEVEEAFANRQYKAATILGGAVLDSVIYWALSGLGKQFPGKPLNGLMLGSLIDLAHSEQLIGDRARNLAKLAKDARNLIHAGVGDRERQQCDKSSSHSVLSAIEAAVTDITEFCRPNNRKL